MSRFLIISSRTLSHSAGLANDMAKGLCDAGHKVDFLTLGCFAKEGEKLSGGGRIILSDAVPGEIPYTWWERRYNRMVRNLYKLRYKVTKTQNLHYPNEWLPMVPPADITRCIDAEYDAVITLFWEDMLNTTSLREIYRTLRCPILIFSPDMAPMTGGCFYFEDCERFKQGCGNCPRIGYGIVNDATRLNFRIKRRNYARMKAVFMGNTWMIRQALDSGLFTADTVSNAGIVVSEEVFAPADDRCVKVGEKNKFTILLRSTPEPRKGNDAMLAAICGFKAMLTAEQAASVEVVTIGDGYFEDIAKGRLDGVRNIGFVDTAGLVDCYRKADLFLSLSLADAGPSMINQAMLCGCPVVAFDNGAAMDLVENGITGYKSTQGDVQDISAKLYAMFISDDANEEMRRNCRAAAMKVNSIGAFAESVERALRLVNKEVKK